MSVIRGKKMSNRSCSNRWEIKKDKVKKLYCPHYVPHTWYIVKRVVPNKVADVWVKLPFLQLKAEVLPIR